jgi:hypothetical protein
MGICHEMFVKYLFSIGILSPITQAIVLVDGEKVYEQFVSYLRK